LSVSLGELLKNFVVNTHIVGLKESIEDNLRVAVFVHLAGSPLELIFNVLTESVFENFALLSAVAEDLVHADLLEVFGPDLLGTLDDRTSNEVRSISVVNEDRNLGSVVLARNDHDLV